MKNNKVLCIGDSTSLPGHTNRYEDTWFFKLKQDFPNYDFISVFRRAITTDILVNEGGGDSVDNLPRGADCLEHYVPDICIVQLGIVDCAPRLIKKKSLESYLLRILPTIISENYINLKKRFLGRNQRNVDVPIEKFQSNLENFIMRCRSINVSKLIFVSICYPNSNFIKKNPDAIINITKYNEVYSQLSGINDFIKVVYPLDSRVTNNIYEDGYHPNKNGNNLVFEKLKNIL